jgi:hypothetical protein
MRAALRSRAPPGSPRASAPTWALLVCVTGGDARRYIESGAMNRTGKDVCRYIRPLIRKERE